MSQHNIIIDEAKRSLRFGSQPTNISTTKILNYPKTLHLPTNSEISKLTERYNIQHIFSSTAHPQSNGMAERPQQNDYSIS